MAHLIDSCLMTDSAMQPSASQMVKLLQDQSGWSSPLGGQRGSAPAGCPLPADSLHLRRSYSELTRRVLLVGVQHGLLLLVLRIALMPVLHCRLPSTCDLYLAARLRSSLLCARCSLRHPAIQSLCSSSWRFLESCSPAAGTCCPCTFMGMDVLVTFSACSIAVDRATRAVEGCNSSVLAALWDRCLLHSHLRNCMHACMHASIHLSIACMID